MTRGLSFGWEGKCLFTRSVLNILLFYREALVCHFLCELAVQVSKLTFGLFVYPIELASGDQKRKRA